MYLRVGSAGGEQFRAVCETLKKHAGNESVFIRCADTGKMLAAPEHMRVTVGGGLESELIGVLGKENVKIIK